MAKTAWRRRCLAGIVFVAVASVLTACSSSSSVSSTSSSGSAAGSSQTTWTIGSICSCSGPFASVYGVVQPTMNAWVSWTNAHGGVDGHQIKMIFDDDAGNPTTALSDVKDLVEKDHVIAIVGSADGNPSVWGQYITAKGVPVIGGENQGPPWTTSPDFYPTGTDYEALYSAYGPVAKAVAAKNVGAIACSETPSCAESNQSILTGVRSAGLKGTFNQLVSSTATDYTPTCLAAKNAGVDALTFETVTPTVLTTAENCANQGFKPHIIISTDGADKSLLNQPTLVGTQLIGNTYPFWDATGPGEDFHAAMSQYVPSAVINQHAASAWAGGLLFQTAAQEGHLGDNPTPADVAKALSSLPSNETLGGYTPPLNLAAGKGHTVPCYFRYEITSSGFSTPYGLAPICPS